MRKKIEVKDELTTAAEKVADAYRGWILANAAYNNLLGQRGVGVSYTLNWEKIGVKPWVKKS